jgi:hypothetical protein
MVFGGPLANKDKQQLSLNTLKNWKWLKRDRKIIAALQVSVDGFIEGPNGEMDWAMEEDEEIWRDILKR